MSVFARMTCRFLEDFTFGALIAPISPEEFRARYWEREPLIIHRTAPDYYGDLFTVEDFDQAVAHSPNFLKTVNAIKSGTSHKTPSVEGLETTLADMRDGGTLIADHLETRDPKLGLLCRLMEAQLNHRFQTNLYLTPPHGKSSIPHWDNHDVFVLQVLGHKNWKVEKGRRAFPRKGERMGDGREFRGETTSFTLRQGDLIYIPRGFMHAAECGTEPSLHISLGLIPYFLEDLLFATINAAIQHDARLHSALSLGFMGDDTGTIARQIKSALSGISNDAFLSAVVSQFKDEAISKFPIDISGQISAHFHPTPLTVDDVVRPRRGIVFNTHASAETVRLNFGSRSILFPDFFREALDYSLKMPSFTIRELPGDLQEEEKVAFVARLIEEGLVVRRKI
jgi:ribosomal protein L16 Arg81 hydroxylase